MVKVEDFWDYLCNKLEYRFFTGMPSKKLSILFDTMSSSLMHYIPAVNEHVAGSMVLGTNIAGFKGAVILDSKNFFGTLDLNSFLPKCGNGILFIAPYDEKVEINLKKFKVKHRILEKLDRDLNYVDNFIDKNSEAVWLLIKEEGLT